MAIFNMMVGIVGSGKSTFAKQVAFATDAVILEADAYREKNYGDAAEQGDNAKLFEEIQADAIRFLSEGRDVVYDATNINYKQRMATIQRMKKFASLIQCWVVMTSIDECKARNAARERKVPEFVIDRMWKSFTMPQYSEGWDAINILFDYRVDKYLLTPYSVEIGKFVQDNPHHSMTLGDHTRKVMQLVGDNTILRYTAFLHDNGKRYTKTFKNTKGEVTDVAHYYGHENCGAYEAAFFMDAAGFAKDDVIYVCGLIQNHMKPYGIEGNEKAHSKLRNLLGEEMYADLMILNQADRNGK